VCTCRCTKLSEFFGFPVDSDMNGEITTDFNF
jgi:hypothetical protein